MAIAPRRSPLFAALVALHVLSVAPACARAARGEDAAPAGSVRRQANLITAEEISEARVSSAYHAVEQLRPAYLRALRSTTGPAVFVNGLRWGGLEALRRIRADEVESIRRLSSSEAHTKYGPGLVGGALDVTTRQGRRP